MESGRKCVEILDMAAADGWSLLLVNNQIVPLILPYVTKWELTLSIHLSPMQSLLGLHFLLQSLFFRGDSNLGSRQEGRSDIQPSNIKVMSLRGN